MENPNLLWLILTYDPSILYALESTNKGLQKLLFGDLSHFHYFLESQFRLEHVRDLDL